MRLDRETFRQNAQFLAAVIGEYGQGRQEQSCEMADDAVDGVVHFRQQGFHPVTTGRSGIDWSGGHWNHNQWRAQLNRFLMLIPLARTFWKSGEESYAEAARDYIEDWMRTHPIQDGWDLASYDNNLNLAIRLQNWFGSLEFFLDAACYDDDFIHRFERHGRMQLDVLDQRTSPGLMNWTIFQAESLLHNGLRLDGTEDAARWQDSGVFILNDAWHRQVMPDGAHIEATPTYHNGMKRKFTDFWRLGKAYPELGVAVDTEKLARMHDYAIAVLNPLGYCNGMHDSKGLRNRETEGVTNLIRFREREAFRKEAGLSGDLPEGAQYFPNAGQALLRSDWSEEAVYVTFDATRWGSGHNHPGRNAIQLYAYGRGLVVDPGSFSYEGSDPFSPYGRSTRAHSTITFNGWNQAEPNPETRFLSMDGYELAASEYKGGYWPNRRDFFWCNGHGPGMYARHHRTLLWIRDRAIIVLDLVRRDENEGPVKLESNWQLGEGEAELDSDIPQLVTRNPDGNVKMLFPLFPAEMRLQLREGWREPLHGWVPGQHGNVPAPLLHMAADDYTSGYANFATVLVPFQGTDEPQVEADAEMIPANDAVVRLRWADGSLDEIYWSAALSLALGRFSDVDTDASLLHRQLDRFGTLCQGLAVDATYARPYAPTPRRTPGSWRL